MSSEYVRAVNPLGVDRDVRVEVHWNLGDEDAALADLDEAVRRAREGITSHVASRPGDA